MTSYDEVVLAGGRILRVHTREKCAGQVCGIHNPSDHPLNHAPRIWRSERALMERECEHGIGHPDPDGLAFLRRTQGAGAARVAGIHGCDGCCRPERKPIPVEFLKRELPEKKPLLLPVALGLASYIGTIVRWWLFIVGVCGLVNILVGTRSAIPYWGFLAGMGLSLSLTFLVHHYKHHHSQYFRRSNQ